MALFAGMLPRLILLLRRVAHYAFYVVGGAIIVVSLVAMVLKFWIMPDVDRFRPDLEAAASKAMGVPVHIDALVADWYGINPRLTLRNVRLEPKDSEPLVLPQVQAVGSWWSLALMEPRLRRLDINDARFPVRRAPDGIITLAGIALNGPGAPSPIPDWLLRQSRIVIKNARISWLDEKLGAPLLQLTQTQLLVENRFGQHRFGGVAQPSDAAGSLDLRGHFKGGSVHDLRSWSGQLFARASQARFESWGHWVPWAQESVKQGEGDVRFWLDMAHGRFIGLTGDARLRNVALSIRPDLPDLRFESLTGRVGWIWGAAAQTVLINKLQFKTPGAPIAEPASLRLTLTPNAQGGFTRVDAEAGNLRLEALTALSGALPLPRRGHDLIEALNPRGLVENARGHWAGDSDYALYLVMRDGGARPYLTFPGISGLNIKLEANQEGGKVALSGHNFVLDWPQIFRHELGLSEMEAHADWHLDAKNLKVAFQAARLANADLEGSAEGNLQLPDKGSPVVDIQGHLSRGEANAVYKYLPRTVADEAYEWLKHSLISGHSNNVRLTLKGDLAHFPFVDGSGKFQVDVPMFDGVLDYAPGWPRIEGVYGMLIFHDRAMSLMAERGRILEAQLGPVSVEIPDLHTGENPIAWVDGYAKGETRTFLDFVRKSPVDRYTDQFISPFTAQGSGILALKLALPLHHIVDTTVGGAYTFQDNTLSRGSDLPELSQVNGAVTFTEKNVQGHNLKMQILDMPATLELNSQEGVGLRAQLVGSATAESLGRYMPAILAKRLRGAAEWHADVGITRGGHASGLKLTSDLTGLALDLPAPLGKPAAESIPLTVDYGPEPKGVDTLEAVYGNLLKVNARLPKKGAPRVHLHLGNGEASEPREPGLTVSGNLPTLDLDTWRHQDWSTPPRETATQDPGGPTFRQADINVGEAILFDRRWHDSHIHLQPAGQGWTVQVEGKEAVGEVTTIPEKAGTRLLARFKRLSLPEPEGTVAALSANSTDTPNVADKLANLDVHIQSLAWKQRDLGEISLRLSPIKTGFQVDQFQLVTPEGRLDGSGEVSDHPRRPTQLVLKLKASNLGKLLARIGYDDAVKGGEAEVEGTLGWMGGLSEFDTHTLEGDLDLNARKGQFLKVDPGAGRLIGILSLQALPRRITLDFRDIFSQGFAFDEITGQVHLENGSAYTKDLRMNGPAAKVQMSGVVSLPDETQQLSLQIQPRLEDTLAVAGAILGGPAVGLGTLIANKVLKNPIGQVAGFEYTVTGTWKDPVITKVSRKPAQPEEKAVP